MTSTKEDGYTRTLSSDTEVADSTDTKLEMVANSMVIKATSVDTTDSCNHDSENNDEEKKVEGDGYSRNQTFHLWSNLTLRDNPLDDNQGTTEMIQRQKKYEKYGKYKCGHKILLWASKFKLLIFNILFCTLGLSIGYFMVKPRNYTLYERTMFYTIYLSFTMFNFSITRLLIYLIMRLLRKSITNSWKVFYIKDIRNRLYFAILCTLWFAGLTGLGHLWGEVWTDDTYDYNDNILKAVICLLISSAAFLISYMFIRYFAITSYFVIFRQRARKLKAYTSFLEIMLNVPDQSLFSIPLMNFLIDFPRNEHKKEAKHHHQKHVAFKFDVENIKMEKSEKKEIVVLTRFFFGDQQFDGDENIKMEEAEKDKIEKSDVDDRTNNMEETKAETKKDEFDELLDSELFAIDLNKSIDSNTKLISPSDLKQLSSLIACLIMVRLHERGKKLCPSVQITKEPTFIDRISTTLSPQMTLSRTYTKKNLKPNEYQGNPMQIDKDLFLVIFKYYNKANKELLLELGQSAWDKFKDKIDDKEILTPKVLSINIIKIIEELLQLKQSIDSYIVIINNLQRMIDVLTPLFLIFVYLYIFNADFEDTIKLYASTFVIIGFFGASYFSSVFASISFIIALNPFLVGDIIWFKNDFYKVEEISLISCVFENCRTGWSHTFQNKVLSSMSHPIINVSRSGEMWYRFIVYFKSSDNEQFLYNFMRECRQKIKQTANKELELIDEKKENERISNASFGDLKSILNFVDELRFKSVALDDYGRRQVFIELKYEKYSWNVRTLVFTCIIKVARTGEFRDYLCENVPLRMEGELGDPMKPIIECNQIQKQT